MKRKQGLSLAILMVALSGGLSAQMRVTHSEAVRAAVRKSVPEYNPVARQMRVEGDVEVEVRIAPTGDVEAVRVVSGNALLTGNVTKSLKDWKFAPFVSDGKPSPAVANLKFTFKL